MRDELEALLREVAFGTDAAVSVDHRLRAAEQLRALGVGEEPYRWERELSELSDDELDVWNDRAIASIFASSDDDERRKRFPETMKAIENEIARRVGEQARPAAVTNGRKRRRSVES